MAAGSAILLDAVDSLSDEDLDAATELPGWTRRHVAAHVHDNAEALRRLVRWDQTGERSPMHDGPEQRAAEIEALNDESVGARGGHGASSYRPGHGDALDADARGRLPEELTAALVADAAASRSRRGEAAALARWLTGRSDEAPPAGPLAVASRHPHGAAWLSRSGSASSGPAIA
jgi:maleylpyruvate isomerase